MMRILIFILIIYGCVGVFLFFAQRSLIYFPAQETNHPHVEFSYEFDDAIVRVVVLNKESTKAILYFGGNAEVVEYNVPSFKRIFNEQAVYLVKYRGYGGSTGEPSEEKIYTDALRIFDELDKEYSEISVIGRSLGSGVATYVASQRSVKKLVLVTPFDSIESLAQKTYPVFPMFLLLKDKYDSVNRVQLITTNTLLLVAENDNVIDRSHSEKLFNAFKRKSPKMVVISDSGHNTISDSQQYNEVLSQFINSDEK